MTERTGPKRRGNLRHRKVRGKSMVRAEKNKGHKKKKGWTKRKKTLLLQPGGNGGYESPGKKNGGGEKYKSSDLGKTRWVEAGGKSGEKGRVYFFTIR